jgi:hypothetical protein
LTGDKALETTSVHYILNGRTTMDAIIDKLKTIFVDSDFTLEKETTREVYTLTIDWVF